jgi:hypothetical protein
MRSLLIAASAIGLLSACSQAVPPPKSASTAEDHAGHDHAGPVTITATPDGPMVPGKPVTLTLRLTDPKGQPIVAADMKVNHGHLLHVMLVDAGLEDYVHAHPTANADGSFSFTFTPRLDRPYRLWADFKLAHAEGGGDHAGHGHGDDKHGGATYASTDLPVGTKTPPALAATQSLRAEVGGLKFQLSLPSALKAGEAVNAQLAVLGPDGKPFTQLQPLMGAYAHIVGFNPGANTMLHVHPEGAEPANDAARGGPVISFTLEPEAAGPQRLFVQVKANGAEVTAPFTVLVAP